MKDRLLNFLDGKGAKFLFINNITDVNDWHPTPDELYDFLDQWNKWNDAIGSAFKWHKSPEGDDFWRGIDKEWKESYRTI